MSQLTMREQEVAGLVARGLTNHQIASELRVSRFTVNAHIQHAANRLGGAAPPRSRLVLWFFSLAPDPPADDPA